MRQRGETARREGRRRVKNVKDESCCGGRGRTSAESARARRLRTCASAFLFLRVARPTRPPRLRLESKPACSTSSTDPFFDASQTLRQLSCSILYRNLLTNCLLRSLRHPPPCPAQVARLPRPSQGVRKHFSALVTRSPRARHRVQPTLDPQLSTS